MTGMLKVREAAATNRVWGAWRHESAPSANSARKTSGVSRAAGSSHAEGKAIAKFADGRGVRAAPEQKPGHVAEADLAFDLELEQAVVVDPEREVLLAGSGERHGGLPGGGLTGAKGGQGE